MPPIRSGPNHTSIGQVNVIVDVLQRSINYLQSFHATEEQVNVYSRIFPMKDFRRTKSGAPAFIPQGSTPLFVTPLHLAAYRGKDDVVKVLLNFSDVNLHPENGMTTPLFLALINGRQGTAKLLLEHGASPHGESCANSLHAAARQGFSDEILHFVHHWHVDPDFQDMDGATPIVYALYQREKKALATISLLLDLGAKADAQVGDHSWTYADLAKAMGKEGLESWLKSRADGSYARTVEFVEAQVYHIQMGSYFS